MKTGHWVNLTALIMTSLVPILKVDAATDCGRRISQMVCEVAPADKIPYRFTVRRPCLNRPVEKYIRILNVAYAKLPAFLQERFCSVEKIYVEEVFFGAAWSAPIDEKNPNRFLIGLRKAELDANLSLADGLAQFDSQTFGTSTTSPISYHISSKNPLTATEFTLIHELGHTFDYENAFNRSATDTDFSKSWTAMSWADIQSIKPPSDFPNRGAICLNNCRGKHIPANEAATLYAELYDHGFLSQLSATNSMEDFADSFAFFVAGEILHTKAKVYVGDRKFDINQIIRSSAFAGKRDFLKRTFKIEDQKP